MPAKTDKQTNEPLTVTSEEVRLNLGELINRVHYRNERVKVTRRGRPVMALVPLEDLELLEKVLDALEDEADLSTVKERLGDFEKNSEGTPWKQIKSERGLKE